MTIALERGDGSASHLGRSLHPGKTRYPLYRRLGGLQGRSGQVWKSLSPPGFDPRTVWPVASHYTDYATGPPPFYLADISETAQQYNAAYLEDIHVDGLRLVMYVRLNKLPWFLHTHTHSAKWVRLRHSMKWSACIWEHGIQTENVCKNENQVCDSTQN
jgi:hypothetical protein